MGRDSPAASGAVIQNGMPPVVLPPANFRKPFGLWERTRGSTFGRAALGFDLVPSGPRGGGGAAFGRARVAQPCGATRRPVSFQPQVAEARADGWHPSGMRAQFGCSPVVSSRRSSTTGHLAGSPRGSGAKLCWIGRGPRVVGTELPNVGPRYGGVIIPCQFAVGEPDCGPEQLRHQHDDDQDIR